MYVYVNIYVCIDPTAESILNFGQLWYFLSGAT